MLAISNTIRRTRTPDGGILLDIKRGQIFSLNAIGSKILDLIETGHDEVQIVEEVSAACGADLGTVRADLGGFLEALNQHHVLEQGAPAATGAKDHDPTDAT